MAVIKQMFAFERTAVPLSSGEFFQPLREANFRWTLGGPEAYRAAGHGFQVLYQLARGGYVYLEYRACFPDRNNTGETIWFSDSLPTGQKIHETQALQFLIRANQEIPEELEPYLAELQTGRIARKTRPVRPLSHWVRHKLIHISEVTPAHEVDVLERAARIHSLAIRVVQCWRDGETGRDHDFFSGELFKRFPVEPSMWWGAKNRVPPMEVGLLDLQWPPGSEEIHKTLRQMQQLIEAPLSVLAATRLPIGHEDLPSAEEQEAARTAALALTEELEQLTIELGKTINAFTRTWDETHPACTPETKLKEPSRNALAAFREHVLVGGTQTEIVERLATNYGITTNQGTVSRWLTEVKEWLAAGKMLPELPSPVPTKVNSMDPAHLDMGANQEGRTLRQRNKRKS